MVEEHLPGHVPDYLHFLKKYIILIQKEHNH